MIYSKMLGQVLAAYALPGAVVQSHQCENGHINDTYVVSLDAGKGLDEVVVQRINSYVFKEPAKVMHNIRQINVHLQQTIKDGECAIINFLDTVDGKNYTVIDGQYWRVCRFVEDSVACEFAADSRVLYSAGFAFGKFQAMLADFPMDQLYETIPSFHDTCQRLDSLFAVVAADPLGLAGDLGEEIAFFEQHKELASTLCRMQAQGEIPLRVTHNDTKYNNILMHKETLEPLCVIDLDTVMPGLAAHDFGDAIRFAANTAREDEPDITKVGLDLNYYREFTRGFLAAAAGFLTDVEIETLPLGAITITIELASRFLADYIDGDKYFRTHRDGHNLDRARCQIRLAQDMLNKYSIMCQIVTDSLPEHDAHKTVAATTDE